MVLPALLLASVSVLSGCNGENLSEQVISLESRPYIGQDQSNSAYTEERERNFVVKNSFLYGYSLLNDAQKIWYDEMVSILDRMGKKEMLSQTGMDKGLTAEDIDSIFMSVMMDHPEFFFVKGYTYVTYKSDGQILGYELTGDYSYTMEEAGELYQKASHRAQEIWDGIPKDADSYEKVKYIYETVIRNTEYVVDARDNQNILSVLLYGQSVCQGYAKTVQYLLNGMGIDCTLVQGKVISGEGHAWNLLNLDGSYYYLDATWGDASYNREAGLEEQQVPDINYEYLCVTTADLMKTHIPREDIPLPDCKDTGDNYFVRENAYFTEYNEQLLTQLFQVWETNPQKIVELKCGNSFCFEQMQRELLENRNIFGLIHIELETLAYSINEEQLSMTFWMTK